MKQIIPLFLGFVLTNGCFPPTPPPPITDLLPTVSSIDANTITIGGFSSGASFATQFHVAYSSIVTGVGIMAGIPAMCSLQNQCFFNAAETSVDQMVSDTKVLENQNFIDSTSNLSNGKVFIAHGTEDTVVPYVQSAKIRTYYESFGMSSNNMKILENIPASHAIISNRRGTPCGKMNTPTFIENCNIDTVYEMFNYFYPNTASPGPDGDLSSSLQKFSQNEFFDEFSSMSETGYYYIPSSCNSGGNSCRLHVYFHGCTMSTDNIGTEFLENSGLLEMADVNNIVLLFPQIKNNPFSNQNGCWNFLGYLGDYFGGMYATRQAVQMKAVFDMIAQMTPNL